MTELERFLAYINGLLTKELPKLKFSKIEKLDIQFAMSQIFESSQDPEWIFYQLLDYFEKNSKLASIKDKVEIYYMAQE